ncbi:MAG: hypothetical protein COA94_01890 [Rickettsiales bacterium]|nr:MAG: hypothetical protein COA94_01890 [Rickettsiales bacterium]
MESFTTKASKLFCLIFLSGLLGFAQCACANIASYISLSSQIARQTQLDVIANNTANANTVGFEQDNLLLRPVPLKQDKKKDISFVWAETTYRSGDDGPLRRTNRPTDLAIAGSGYFKLRTPKGDRYTLDGSMIINNQGILVNHSGFPYLSIEGAEIEIPNEWISIDISQNGVIFVDEEEVGQIGVFQFESADPVIKEGKNLYAIQGKDRVLEDFTVISGALRGSNVNATLAMAKMVEMQRAFGLVSGLVSKIEEVERSVISKLAK